MNFNYLNYYYEQNNISWSKNKNNIQKNIPKIEENNDPIAIKNFEILKSLIGRYSILYLTNEGYTVLEIPDSKNLTNISKEGSFNSKCSDFRIERNSIFNKENDEFYFKTIKKKFYLSLVQNPNLKFYSTLTVLFLILFYFL